MMLEAEDDGKLSISLVGEVVLWVMNANFCTLLVVSIYWVGPYARD